MANQMTLTFFQPATDGTELTHKTWPAWLLRFENILQWHDVAGERKDQRQIALLFATGGPELQRIYNRNVGLRKDQTKPATYAETLELLTTVFNRTRNTYRDELEFRKLQQGIEESFDSFLGRLRSAAGEIIFKEENQTPEDRQIILQAMVGTRNAAVRQALLRETTLTVDLVTTLGMVIERAQAWTPEVTIKQEAAVNAVGQLRGARFPSMRGRGPSRPRGNYNQMNVSNRREESCPNCGFETHRGGRVSCPAYSQECRNCGRIGHFWKMCRSRKVEASAVETYSRDNDDFSGNDDRTEGASSIFAIDANTFGRPEILLEMNGNATRIMIDSGADVTVINQETYEEIGKPKLYQSTRRLRGFGSDTALPLLGICEIQLKKHKNEIVTEVFVVKGVSRNLLGCSDAVKLGVLMLDLSAVEETGDFNVGKSFPKFFSGLGKYNGEPVKLTIDATYQPVAITNRRIPFHQRPRVDEEIRRLLDLDIIEEMSGPSPWVSPLVIVPKPNGRIRMCVDSRKPNEAIMRKIVMMPTLEDLLVTFNGCKWFSKIDLNDGYHQLVLDENSRNITAFATHNGLYRYKRLSFGINAAAEIFQEKIESILPRELGIRNAVDDILIGGETKKQHDERLWKVLTALTKANLTGNVDKCDFFKRKVSFFGHVFSAEGVEPQEQRVTQISELKPPTNNSELKSLLGMITYCSRFIPNLAELLLPMREKRKHFEWTTRMEEAWKTIRQLLQNAPTLGYFDERLETAVITDAGPEAVAGILVQFSASGDQLVRGYFSKTLTETEKKYPQIDREMVGVVATILHFWIYLIGKPFRVYTDHMPLVQLMNKAGSTLPARVQRLFLKIQECQCEWKYISGASNPADYLSRHPIGNNTYHELTNVEFFIDQLAEEARPRAWTEETLLNEIEKDQTMIKLREILRKASEPAREMKKHVNLAGLSKMAGELTVTSKGIILKQELIFLPTSLQQQAIQLAHEGHQGVVKTKALLRSKVWFEGLDTKVEQFVKRCTSCALVTVEKVKEPFTPTEIPPGPWRWLTVDYTTIGNNDYLLVFEDIFTKYPVFFRVTSTEWTTFRKCFEEMCALFGLPDRLFSDNGPPFNSHDFADFMRRSNIEHRKSIPAWPCANGQVERLMTSINKTMRIALLEKEKINDALRKFLVAYRNTKHTTTGKTPAAALFAYTPRTTLTMIKQTTERSDVNLTHAQQIQRFTDAANRGRLWEKTSRFGTGDLVYARQNRTGKFDPAYDPRPFRVEKAEGQRIFLERDGIRRQRNRQTLKRAFIMDKESEELIPVIPQQVQRERERTGREKEQEIQKKTQTQEKPSEKERTRIDYIPHEGRLEMEQTEQQKNLVEKGNETSRPKRDNRRPPLKYTP